MQTHLMNLGTNVIPNAVLNLLVMAVILNYKKTLEAVHPVLISFLSLYRSLYSSAIV